MTWSTTASAAIQTQAQLVLSSEVARPGEVVTAAVRLKMADGWHTYWRNGGDSGGPTEIAWTLPPGVTAGEIQWPVPEKYVQESITTYVYHKEAVLLVPLTLSNHLPAGPLSIKAQVAWLECEELCQPGRANLTATLVIGGESKPSTEAALFAAARKKLPQPFATLPARPRWETVNDNTTRSLLIEWGIAEKPAEADFYPHSHEGFEVLATVERLPDEAGQLRLRKVVKKSAGDWPRRMEGLLVAKYGGGRTVALEGPLVFREEKAPADFRALLVNLLFALGGGLILNLMPCVLPVIALKILSFVKQSGGSAAETRRLGLIYGLGVLVSLLVLAGLVIALQQAGRAASWGMHFQNPIFVVAMTILITLVALNLFGLFEVTLGGGALGAAGTLSAKGGAAGAFFNGVLAVVLATPCTAPFLATALGFAFAQPPATILMVFAAVAIGLALPYVVLSFFPKLLRFLPKPGAWMERFKVVMGFPMLATAVWLYSVARSQLGKDGGLRLGLFLVVLALAVWIWGQFVQRGTGRRGLAMGFSALLLAGSALYALTGSSDQIRWQPWSAAAVAKARSEGRPVLVDFTADWCLTCQANKKTSLEIPSVRQKLKDINAVAFLGDYTLQDPAITEELKRFERAGVPLVLVYPKDAAKPPQVLPTLLTPTIVLDALDQAAK